MATIAATADVALGPPQRRSATLRYPASGHMLARTAARFADVDLAVDLGRDIGSVRWWRGLATFTALAGAAFSLGVRVPAIEGPVPAAPTPAAIAESQPDAFQPLSMGATTGFQAAPTKSSARWWCGTKANAHKPHKPAKSPSGR